MATPRETITEATGDSRREAPTEFTKGGAYGAGSSSSSEERGKGPEVTVVSGQRQVVPSLVDVASSAELLSRLTIPDDRAKPVSSNVAHARTSVIDDIAAAAEAKSISTVK